MRNTARFISVVLLAVLLVSCGMPSSLDIAEDNDRIEISAQNAKSVWEGSAEIKLEQGEQLIIESGVESGGIGVTIRLRDDGSSAAFVFEEIFDHPEERVLQMEPGLYEVMYEVTDIGTYGTLTIRKQQPGSSAVKQEIKR